MKNSKSGIQKYHFWLLFFFAIFGGTFSMIVWTVKSAVDTPVYDDRSFLSSYHDIDYHFNDMMISNAKFNARYNALITVNNRTIAFEIKDVFLGQRSLEKQSVNQDMLQVGENTISIVITDKKTNEKISNAEVNLQVTRAIEDMYDINLNSIKFDNGTYKASVKIDLAGNWNITGSVTVGEYSTYLYIKSNTKK